MFLCILPAKKAAGISMDTVQFPVFAIQRLMLAGKPSVADIQRHQPAVGIRQPFFDQPVHFFPVPSKR